MKKLIILLFLTTSIINCSSQKVKNGEELLIEVILNSFDKIHPNIKKLSNETGIKETDLTSTISFSIINSTEVKVLPINDKKFNYEYFNKNIYPNMMNKKAKLYLDIYKIDLKKVAIVYKIE